MNKRNTRLIKYVVGIRCSKEELAKVLPYPVSPFTCSLHSLLRKSGMKVGIKGKDKGKKIYYFPVTEQELDIIIKSPLKPEVAVPDSEFTEKLEILDETYNSYRFRNYTVDEKRDAFCESLSDRMMLCKVLREKKQ